MNITLAQPDELPAITPFLDEAYGFAPGFFGGRLAWQWSADCVDWSGVFVARDDAGALMALVRVWEMELIQGGYAVTCGGIGSVATGKNARGQGTMSALMNYAVDAMKARGYPIAILWGERFRYAPFGFESGGRALQFEITNKGLNRCQIEAVAPSEFDDGIVVGIESARAAMPFHKKRTASELARLYAPNLRRVLAAGTGENFGWLTLDKRAVVEWGGNMETVLGLTKWGARENLADKWSFLVPVGAPIPASLRRAMSGYSMNTAWCRAAILDLPATLRAFDCTELESELANCEAREQVWRLFGGPDAPRNLWVAPIDTI